MEFREYLFRNRLSVIDAAKELGISRPYLSLVVNGRVKPGKRLAKDIEIYTNHEVKSDCIAHAQVIEPQKEITI